MLTQALKSIRLLLFVFVFSFGTTIIATADEIDDFVKAEMKRQRFPGVSIAVIKDGKIIKAAGYGLADVEHDIAAKPETVFKIASVSKQFIASGIMLLVEGGEIGIDDRVNKYFKDAPETWQGITIRHLLTHTSGLVREAPGFDPFKIQTDADVIKTAYQLPLRFTPGEKYEYCNLSYFMLAEIIHKVSGKSWQEFISTRIFAPPGMTATRATTTIDLVPNRADGYDGVNNKLQNAQNYIAVRPSGAFLSSVLDLAKWEEALISGKILKPSTLSQMWTPVTLNNGRKSPYGFGWQLEDLQGIPTIAHSGSLPGFRSRFLRIPSQKLTVIVLSNLGGADVEWLADGIAIRSIPKINLALLKPQPSPNIETNNLLKKVLQEYANGENDIKQVTPELRSTLKDFRKAHKESLRDRLKKEHSIEFLSCNEIKDKGIERLGVPVNKICFYRFVTSDKSSHFSFYFTSDQLIAWFKESDF